MAEGGEKTEEATPHQMQKARERGEVAQSRDATSALLLAVAFAALAFQIPTIGRRFEELGIMALRVAVEPGLSTSAALDVLVQCAGQALLLVLPVLAVVFLFGFVGPFAQVGPLISFEAMQPKLSKLNPLSGLKRMVSLPTYIELAKSALKVSVIGILAYQVVKDELRNLLLLSTQPPGVIAGMTGELLKRIVIRALVFFALLAALDFFYQRWQHRKKLRMSKEEVKKEYKEQEGDPTHKAERRRLHEEIASENMFQEVRKADVIVTNPTHIACALRYDPDDEDAPRLLGKGQGHIAERIKQIAKEEDIPVVRDISLAHALYEMEMNQEVPEELFDAVAEILKWVEAVMKAQGETPKWVEERKG